MVGPGRWDPGGDQVAIADCFDLLEAMARHQFIEGREDFVQEDDDIFRGESFRGGSEAGDTSGPEPEFECLRRKICKIGSDRSVRQDDFPWRGTFAADAGLLPGSLSPGTKPSIIGEQID